jgi:hypothetical protein
MDISRRSGVRGIGQGSARKRQSSMPGEWLELGRHATFPMGILR